jgi:uncharacterized caspase-like protein
MVRAVIFLFLLALMPSAATAQAEKRIALLIGNQDYNANVGRLKNPHDDVALVGAALKELGFQVTILNDADYRAMDVAIKRFVTEVRAKGKGTISFFYYSGHGAANPETQINYLIPVDIADPNDGNLWYQSFQQNDLIDKLSKQAPNATHYVVFDACRNELNLSGPAAKAIGAEKGFVPVPQTPGLLIAYATAQGKTATDVGDNGGPYARALAAELVRPGIEAVTMFRNVQIRVREDIGQDPWLSFPSLPPVYLAGKPDGSTPTTPPAVQRQLSEAAEAWIVVKNTNDVSVLEAFVARYGATFYSELARARIENLKAQQLLAARKKQEDDARADAERQRLAILQQQKELADARAKTEAERQRLALLQEEERKRAEAEETRRKAEIQSESNECLSRDNDLQKNLRGCSALIARNDLTSQQRSVAFISRCNAYLNHNDQARGMADCNQAVALNSSHPKAYLNRGRAYAMDRQIERAITDYDKAISLDPNLFIVYVFRGKAHEFLGNRTKAISDYRYALSHGVDNNDMARNGLQRLGVKP